jgi:hypothetical protein
MGERTAFIAQAKRTACTFRAPVKPLAFPVKRRNQREQTPRRIKINLEFSFQPFDQ